MPPQVNSDALARCAVLGERLLTENSETVLARVLVLPSGQQFDALEQWVLPGAEHSDLRMSGHFGGDAGAMLSEGGGQVVGRRGNLLSPAIALVDVAVKEDRLAELETVLTALEPSVVSVQQQRAHAAFRFLVDDAQQDDAGAVEQMNRLFDLFVTSPPTGDDDRWPELVAVEIALESEAARKVAGDLLTRSFEMLERDEGGWRTRATPEWLAHFMHQLERSEADDHLAGSIVELANWKPATLEKARTAGPRLPTAEWRMGKKPDLRLRRTVAHEDDLLFYGVPLQGDFEIECDLKPYVWQGMQWLIGEQSVAPDGSRSALEARGIRARDIQRVRLSKQLSVSDGWAHFRAVVHDGECRAYFDGRHVQTRRLDLAGTPWVALRNPVPHRGTVRDVRISGAPVVPRELRLAEGDGLAGWFSWFEDDEWSWRQVRTSAGEVEVRRDHATDLGGTNCESLLQYYRPMFEDGTITYEFFYEPGSFDVHPAIGRTAVMLQPDGVAVHRVTCGRYGQSDLRTDDLSQAGSESVALPPLRQGDWNRVSVTVSGDNLRVTLNDEAVYEAEIDSTGQRNFGLFHFADQSGVRVRNIVWRGSWPGSVPEVATQQLANATQSMLERSTGHLTATFEHDFATDGLPRDRFVVFGTDEESTLDERDDGLHFTRPCRKPGYVDAWLAPLMRVQGDFDITVEFAGLQFRGLNDGMQSVTLGPVFEDAKATHVRVFRGVFVSGGRTTGELCQAETHRQQNGGYRALYHGEARSEALAGQMRVSRRGETVYWLLAENDSSQFRVLYQERVTNASLCLNGLRLTLHMVAESEAGGEVSVVWKRLSVRAESISDLPVSNSQQFIAELNEHRDHLADGIGGVIHGGVDWRKVGFTGGTVSSAGESGLRITGVGSDNWTSSRVGFLSGVSGDYDVSVTFQPTVFDNPTEGQQSAIYLRSTIPADEYTSVDLVLVRKPDGSQTVLAEFVTFTGNGPKFQDFGVQNVKTVERLRLVRHGTDLTFLFAEKATGDFRILARTEVPPGDLQPQSFRFEVQTGGQGKRTVVDLKEFTLKAEKLVGQPGGGTIGKRGGT